ncbi:MAG: hypothetical protein HY424_01510 [Candidatus Levybacteria bacterium]|nr:hypothetical protein [Candidatus Levybacteria bacterium]
MKNKKLIIAIVVILVVLVGGVSIFMVTSKKSESVVVEQTPTEEKIAAINPEEIGLTLTASSDNRKVILEVSKTDGISGLDYELSYISKGDIPRGVIGHIDVKQIDKAVRQEITLGTCSDVCHYDEDVSNIKLILKVTKTDGTSSQAEKSLEL